MRKALAIDLDGTLLSTNTFRDYLSYCVHAALYAFRLDLVACIVCHVTLRKLRIITHSTLKRRTLRCTASFMQRRDRLDHFVEAELLTINAQAQQVMEQYRGRGHMLVLCTAAPSLYAHPIAEILQIDHCCATPIPSEVVLGQWRENVGQVKLQSLDRLLRRHDAQLDVVITDHHDDLPLLNSNEGNNYVVAPSSKTLQELKQNCKKPYSIL